MLWDCAEIFNSFLSSIREPLIVLDCNLKVVTANPSFYACFGVNPHETEGFVIYELGNRQWDIPKLRVLIEDVLPNNSKFHDFEVEHYFENIGPKIMLLNARQLHNPENNERFILLAIEDITEREMYKRNLEKIVEERTSKIRQLSIQLKAERAYLQEEIKSEYNHENIIGNSDAINYVLYKVEQIAAVNSNVLILGETGTGKELVARAIHGTSPRRNRTLVKMNCAALPPELIDSELFGHEKGSFTGAQKDRRGRFEIADGGTLFLDEIGELPVELQPKLLRVLEDGEFERIGSSKTQSTDVRIIAATNRNLEDEIKKGNFREDLWYRLNVFPITMPPLRDRLQDIPLLVNFYIKKISRNFGKEMKIIPTKVINTLCQYNWPGNVRELKNVLERAVINSSGPKLRLMDDWNPPKFSLETSTQTLEQVERSYILQVLESTDWKVSGSNSAAEILGLARSTLRARMRKLDIRKP